MVEVNNKSSILSRIRERESLKQNQQQTPLSKESIIINNNIKYKPSILSTIRERKISEKDVKPEYLEFWKQKFDRDSLRAFSPEERVVLKDEN